MDKKFIKILFFVLMLMLGYFLIKPLIKTKGENTEVIVFGLGKADSIFMRSGKENILIDTGEKKHGDKIINSLKNLGIDKIDYLVLSHPDKDHIGGAVKIIDNFEIGKVLQSSFQKGSKSQISMNQSIKEKKIENIILKDNTEIKVGKLVCTIYAPEKEAYKKSNDYSLVMLSKDKKLNYLFTGDAEEERIEELLSLELPKIDLLKVPHHGRSNNASSKLIEKLSPRYAIITNFESEASQEVLDAFKKEKTKVFYTPQKDMKFLSDGEKLQFY